VLDSEEYMDQPPREVYASLLGKGEYLCSVSTMYRILRHRGPVRDRRAHRERTHHAVPRLEATAPNQVWTWDITKLPTEKRGEFLSLYVILDLFSRYIVAWMVAKRENSALAKQLFAEAIERYGVEPGTLIVHQDRGAPMTSHGFADLLAELGVDRSYSRPRVSNDNPQSESQFHTMKYQPDYPGLFRHADHARSWCTDYFQWYNEDHHHTGLALHTPADVYFDRLEEVAAQRQQALSEVFAAHPERFPLGPPRDKRPPSRVVINPPEDAPTVNAAQVLAVADLGALWPTQPAPESVPLIVLPGAALTVPVSLAT
jgi:putative transposase